MDHKSTRLIFPEIAIFHARRDCRVVCPVFLWLGGSGSCTGPTPNAWMAFCIKAPVHLHQPHLGLGCGQAAEARMAAPSSHRGAGNCDVDVLDHGHDEMHRYKSLSHGPAPKVMKVDGLEAAVAQALESVEG